MLYWYAMFPYGVSTSGKPVDHADSPYPQPHGFEALLTAPYGRTPTPPFWFATLMIIITPYSPFLFHYKEMLVVDFFERQSTANQKPLEG